MQERDTSPSGFARLTADPSADLSRRARARTLQWLLTVTAVASIPAGAVFISIHIAKNQWATVGSVALVTIGAAVLALARRLPHWLRTLLYLLNLGTAATFLLFQEGPTTKAFALIIAIVTLALALMGWRSAVAAGVAMASVIITAAVLQHYQIVVPRMALPPSDPTQRWIIGGVSMLMVGTLIVGTVYVLLRHLHLALKERLALADSLTVRQAELQDLELRLLHSQKLEIVGQLAGGMAHDLNNSLTVIMGAAELSHDEKARKRIVTAADAAGQLTRQLLSFSRRDRPHPRTIDLVAEISSVTNPLKRIVPSNIAVTVTLPSTGALCVRADPVQVQQVLFNLVVNARDAMPEGGEINITLRADGENAALVVQDTGEGMDAATQERIFEPFFTTKPASLGTGLGLVMVRQILEQLGGRIDVDSTAGAGTTMIASLPLTTAVASARTESPIPRGAGQTILVADDNDGVRRVLTDILEANGYQVLPASDGKQAIDHLEAHGDQIALVLTDVVMPVMGGLKVQAWVLDHLPRLPVLMCTGHAADEDLDEEHHTGRLSYLTKPISRDELLRAVAAKLSS